MVKYLDMPNLNTIHELFCWIYANLGMAHFALEKGFESYNPACYTVRSRLFRDLKEGKSEIQSLFSDEKDKLKNPRCAYCGSLENLSLDHLVPRFDGGSDCPNNLVIACRHCNSAKGKTDLLEWYLKRNDFPPILVLRRYLKLAHSYLKEADALGLPVEKLTEFCSTFKLDLLPHSFPQPQNLLL